MLILRSEATGYAFKPKAPSGEVCGDFRLFATRRFQHPKGSDKGALLIGGMQARNNARVVLCGSLKFFSDEFFNAQVEQNKQ